MNKAPLLIALTLFCAPLYAQQGYTNPLGMRFIEVPAGDFTMGTADPGEAAMAMPDGSVDSVRDETPAHRVHFARPLLLGRTEVTQGQWLAVMENRPGPAANWQHEQWQVLPVVSVSWPMAQRFAEELGKLDPGHRYRLPTEAEWEYAARAGSEGLYPWPEDQLEQHAWFINNSGDQPHPVATREANAFGLHDMIGNVWEWTGDWYAADRYAQLSTVQPANDPIGPQQGSKRVRRGGSFHCPLHMTRVGYRAPDAPGSRYSVLGLRVVAEPVVAE